ncbi:EAL domain-containing protein [Vibrio salinus]|uniref:EAL domain-containing protein n=1 Tax=Vibrio salinus TaxID=2899784 RepID=UPI001E5A4A24|nr:EAL domain-containing protein [Vibrio salinus]MCE0494787.1 EAL domain-containing protein [Vibrio salinus]
MSGNDNDINLKAITFISSKSAGANIRIYRYTTLSVLFTFLLSHFIIVYNDFMNLKYNENTTFELFERAAFQVKNTLDLDISVSTRCTEKVSNVFKDILKTYYYIGDIGLVRNGMMSCSLFSGKYPIKVSNDKRKNGEIDILHFNNTKSVYDNIAFEHNGIVVFLSKAYLRQVNKYPSGKDGSGIVIHSKDRSFIYNYIGDIDKYDLDFLKASNIHDSDYSFLYKPSLALERCSRFLKICTTALDNQVGLYGLSIDKIIYLFLLGLSVGVAVSYIQQLRYSGIRHFLRKLKKALKNEEIRTVYQPQYALSSKQLTGIEVLARWNDIEYGYVPPDIFITVCEVNGLTKKMTNRVILSALDDVGELLRANRNLTISFNISTDIFTDAAFMAQMSEILARFDIATSQVILEITERTTSDQSQLVSARKALHKLGFKISIDDFGTGFSNLSWLSTLEPDEIKIDKMFTQSISSQNVNTYALNGIIHMLKELTVSIVAEGIETEEQYRSLKDSLSNVSGQGWYFSRPVDIKTLSELVRSSSIKENNNELKKD